MRVDLDSITDTLFNIGMALVVFLLAVFMLLVVIILVKSALASDEIIWMQSNGSNYQMAIIQPDQEEPIEVDIKEDDVLEHSLDRELLRQEERREQWWQEDYRDFLREQGVSEGLMRGW